MKLTINNETHDYSAADSAPPTVHDVVEYLGLGGRPVAVEVNGELVPKRRHAETSVGAEDKIEVVTLVGGG